MYSTVFLPECAIAGIPCYNERLPPEKGKKRENLALSFYKTTG